MVRDKIVAVDVKDIRFPTSLNRDGSDAMVQALLDNLHNDMLAASVSYSGKPASMFTNIIYTY